MIMYAIGLVWQSSTLPSAFCRSPYVLTYILLCLCLYDTSDANSDPLNSTPGSPVSATSNPPTTRWYLKDIKSWNITHAQHFRHLVSSYLNLHSNSSIVPHFWLSQPFLNNYTAAQQLFWTKYAFCNNRLRHITQDFVLPCEEYYKANVTGLFSPVWHATDTDTGWDDSNILEGNPLRCHRMELVRTTWAHSPHYIYHFQQLGLQYFPISVRFEESNITIQYAFDNEPPFTCRDATRLSLIARMFSLWEEEGPITDYSPWYDDYANAYDDEYESTEPTPTTPATTSVSPTISQLTTTTANTKPYNLCKTGTRVQYCKPSFRWPPLIPEPFGTVCPINISALFEKLNLPYNASHDVNLLKDKTNKAKVTCVADFPNLPIFGRFETLNAFSPYVVKNISFPPIDKWWDIMALGTQTWRYPLVITDPVPQPFANLLNSAPQATSFPRGLSPFQVTCLRSVFATMIFASNGTAEMGWFCFRIPPLPKGSASVYIQGLKDKFKLLDIVVPSSRYVQRLFNFTGIVYAGNNTNNVVLFAEYTDLHIYNRTRHAQPDHFSYFSSPTEQNVSTPFFLRRMIWEWRNGSEPLPNAMPIWNLTHIYLFNSSNYNASNPAQALSPYYSSPTVPVFILTDYSSKLNVSLYRPDAYMRPSLRGAQTGGSESRPFPEFFPVLNLSDPYISDNIHRLHLPCLPPIHANAYNDTLGFPFIPKTGLYRCHWSPIGQKNLYATHRSIYYNHSVYDVPMNIYNASVINSTYYPERSTLSRLDPAVTIINYAYPAIQEITLHIDQNPFPNTPYMYPHYGCSNKSITDSIVRYNVEAADNHSVSWWLTAGMDFSRWPRPRKIGYLPYYFYMLAPGKNNRWYVYDMVSHTILKNNTDLVDNFRYSDVYEVKLDHKMCYRSLGLEPCLIHRGGFNSSYSWITAHFPRSVIFPPWNPMISQTAPMYMPLTYAPIRVLIQPVVTPIHLVLDLAEISSNLDPCALSTPAVLPDLYYNLQGTKSMRRPLQAMAIGAFLAGTTIGSLIAGAMTAELRAELTSVKSLVDQHSRILHGVSRNLHTMSALLDKLQAEYHILHSELRSLQQSYAVTTNMLTSAVSHLQTQQECHHVEALLRASFMDLRSLFLTGIGQETSSMVTILDPTHESYCDNGKCSLHLWEISTSQAIVAYKTKPTPRYVDGTWLMPLESMYWATFNNLNWFIPESSLWKFGKNTAISFELIKDVPPTTDVSVHLPTSSISDLGNYRILTCHSGNYSVQRWHNASFNDFVDLNPGCHLHSNVMMVRHIPLDKTALTHVAYISNHTFGLNAFFKTPAYADKLEATVQSSLQAMNNLFAQNEKVYRAYDKAISKDINQLSHSTAHIQALVEHSLLTPRHIFQDSHKDCTIFGFFRRLVAADFTCITRWNPWHWIKQTISLLVFIIGALIILKLLLFTCRRISAEQHAKITKLQLYHPPHHLPAEA